MKQRHIRTGDDLDDDDTEVVRGGRLDPALVRDDAVRMFNVYGVYGISCFALHDLTLHEIAQQPPLVRFSHVQVTTVRALRSVGLTLEPTGRNPRHYTILLPDLGPAVETLCSCQRRLWPTRTMSHEPPGVDFDMKLDIDLEADLNAQDDDGLGWSTLRDAKDPSRVRPGAMLLAGNRAARAVVRVTAVDDDGQVHFTILPGPVDKNRHLLGRIVS